jgi:hypothetical protein
MIKRFNWAGMAENDPSPLWQASDFVKTTPGQVAAAGKMSHDRKRPVFLGESRANRGFQRLPGKKEGGLCGYEGKVSKRLLRSFERWKSSRL